MSEKKSDKRLVWVETCPECNGDGCDGMNAPTACQMCKGTGEIRTELTDWERKDHAIGRGVLRAREMMTDERE